MAIIATGSKTIIDLSDGKSLLAVATADGAIIVTIT